ncbi:MAG: hypothetical protein DMG09_17935, partial [Acidobacteria bacterium]
MLAVLAAACTLEGKPLRAGVAKADVTPPAGEHMWGYAERQTPAQGTLDPLYARVLVLEAADERLAWVDLDLGRPFGPEPLRRLRETARKSNQITHLLVQATHTHSGPVVMDAYQNEAPAWEAAAIAKIEKAIDE